MASYDSKLLDSFKSFINEDKFSDYETYDSYFGNVVLTRVYYFEPDDFVSGLIDTSGRPLVNDSKRRVLTFGKVIAVGDECTMKLEKGDIVALSDNLISIQDNPAFLDYLIQTNGEKAGGIDVARPSATINSFITYRNTYGFVGNKIKEGGADKNDFFTFLFPSSFIKAKVDRKKLVAWIDGQLKAVLN